MMMGQARTAGRALVLAGVFCTMLGGAAAAGPVEWWESHGFVRMEVQASGAAQEPVLSTLNFGNLLEFPRYRSLIELKPELRVAMTPVAAAPVEFTFEPRAHLSWDRWEDGGVRGEEEYDATAFVHEWSARAHLGSRVRVGYARENLQWGPSHLISPSNPFTRDNGLDDLRYEVAGREYAQMTVIPSLRTSVSFFANLDPGRDTYLKRFDPVYAVKADWTMRQLQSSVVLSNRVHGARRAAGFANATVGDAWLFWVEGGISDRGGKPEVLAGGSYTFAFRGTLVAEAFHDGDGCLHDRIDRCFFGPAASASAADVLFRRNYLMLEWIHPYIGDIFSAHLRWTHGLDDRSNRVIALVEYDLTDATQLFATGHVDTGSPDDEFGALLRRSLAVGARWIY